MPFPSALAQREMQTASMRRPHGIMAKVLLIIVKEFKLQ